MPQPFLLEKLNRGLMHVCARENTEETVDRGGGGEEEETPQAGQQIPVTTTS